MSNATQNQSTLDPVELWHQWYDSTTRAWTNVLGEKRQGPMNPLEVYQQWLKGLESIQDQVRTTSPGDLDYGELWKAWVETTTQLWEKMIEAGVDVQGLPAQWMEMMEEVRAKLLAGEKLPTDPLSFALQWYNATSETWSKLVGDIIGTEAVVDLAARSMESYVGFARTFNRMCEEYFHNLQLPTRSDVARVASLVVALENKIDRIEETVSDFEFGNAKPATAESITELEQRLVQFERKLDQVLVTVAKKNTSPGAS